MNESLQAIMDKLKGYSDAKLRVYAMYDAAIAFPTLTDFDTLANYIIDELVQREISIDIPIMNRRWIKQILLTRKDPVGLLQKVRQNMPAGPSRNAAPRKRDNILHYEEYFLELWEKAGMTPPSTYMGSSKLNEGSEESTADSAESTEESKETYEVLIERTERPRKNEASDDNEDDSITAPYWVDDPLPQDYVWSPDGKLILWPPKSPKPLQIVYPERICIKRLLFTSRDPDAVNKAEISFDCDGTEKIRILSLDELYNESKLKELAKYGALINSNNSYWLARFFFDYIREFRPIIRRGYITQQVGWTSNRFDSFVPYFSNEVYDNQKFKAEYQSILRQKGTYEEWASLIKPFRDVNHIPFRIILAASFASILAEPLMYQPFFLNIVGRSQNEKTPTLKIVTSVWADPSKRSAYIKSLGGSDPGLETAAHFYGSFPYCLNESQLRAVEKRDPNIDMLIYLLGDGTPKPRANGSGGILEQFSWCNAIFITGEEELTRNSKSRGVRMRVLDLEVKDSIISSNDRVIEALLEDLEKHYNTAGEEFVRRLLDGGLARAKEIYNSFRDQIPPNVERRQNHIAATILTADVLIAEWIFGDTTTLTVDDLLPYLKTRDVAPEEVDYATVQQEIYNWIRNEIGEDFTGTTDKGRVIEANGRKMFAFYNDNTLIDLLDRNDCDRDAYFAWAKENGALAAKEGDGNKRVVSQLKSEPRHGKRLYVLNLPQSLQSP